MLFMLLPKMVPNNRTQPYDPELAASYAPLLDQSHQSLVSPYPVHRFRRPVQVFAGVLLSTLLLLSLILTVFLGKPRQPQTQVINANLDKSLPLSSVSPRALTPISTGVSHGVSEKTFGEVYDANDVYPWTHDMLSWQRPSYHFQPAKNWMGDPNGPLFHMGWYHFFYQHNPDSPIWGNITWGHAVSRDLIHWLHLPFAMVPDEQLDIHGVLSGSATTLPDGQIIMLYTSNTADFTQVQSLAYPANLSDPLLLDWIKYPDNPIMLPPPGIGYKDFRDPSTAWLAPDGKKWLLTLGSMVNTTGIALMYETSDFKSYKLLDGILHAVQHTRMWECVDFYPVSTVEGIGLDTSTNGPGIKHVLKVSLDDDFDYYALGTYDPHSIKWTPDNPELDAGIGLRLDYGKYYASKTFYDQNKKRRILRGFIRETDSPVNDLVKGWACIEAIPRSVVFDKMTGTNVLHWPVQEVEELRQNGTEFDNIKLEPGSIVPLNIGSATQLDIIASFEVEDKEALEATVEADVGYNCATSGGAAGRGLLGPFGLLVLADESLSELTPVYFYISKGTDGRTETHFCADASRSSRASDVTKQVRGSAIPVLEGEKLSARLLVDHSIIESFGQGGRAVITSRVYPTRAIYGAARVFFFNNATGVGVTASAKIWQMDTADIHAFPQPF